MPSSTVYTDDYSIYDRLATKANGYVITASSTLSACT